MTLEGVFWTQVASLVAFVGAVFLPYRILVKQKDATIELLNARITGLESDVARERASAPDVLVERMRLRKAALEEELELLHAADVKNAEAIRARDEELSKLRDVLEQLREIANEFFCEYCGAEMTTREYGEISMGFDDTVEAEYVVFACGREIGPFHSTPCPQEEGSVPGSS